MWYVNKLFDQAQVESLAAKGFLVRSSGGVVRIEKYGCGAELRKSPAGHFQMTIIPSIMHQGQFTRLWDAGYQKFLLTNEGLKLPIRVAQLGDLRTVQRRAADRARRAHLLQRSPRFHLPVQRLRPRQRPHGRRAR